MHMPDCDFNYTLGDPHAMWMDDLVAPRSDSKVFFHDCVVRVHTGPLILERIVLA